MTDDDRAALLAKLDEIGRVAFFATSAIDEALLAGVPPLEVSRRTGRDRAGLHRRLQRLLGANTSVGPDRERVGPDKPRRGGDHHTVVE